jgi:2-polyprenyl-3-methyl-5-hydroxy-6-metoxy-1,4-benzoquinol methylase
VAAFVVDIHLDDRVMAHAMAHDALDARARASLGSSSDPIYRMVADALAARAVTGGRLIDVGCGSGRLWHVVSSRFDSYCGVDAVRYESFPREADFRHADLDQPSWPIDEAEGDVIAAVEVIEHLENPWAFVRALAGAAKPGGWVLATTPNQLSALSLLTVVVKQRFSAFQDAHYPVHKTALLASDLVRMFGAAGLERIEIMYSRSGRMPLAAAHFPGWLSARFPRVLSDNVLAIGRKPFSART